MQLPSFTKDEEACETDFERWIYVLKNMETLNRLPFKARKAVFQRLEDIVDIASLTKEERIRYDESIKVYRDNLVTEAYALEKGRAEGRAEERVAIIQRLKRKGFSSEEIANMMDLPLDKIEAL